MDVVDKIELKNPEFYFDKPRFDYKTKHLRLNKKLPRKLKKKMKIFYKYRMRTMNAMGACMAAASSMYSEHKDYLSYLEPSPSMGDSKEYNWNLK